MKSFSAESSLPHRTSKTGDDRKPVSRSPVSRVRIKAMLSKLPSPIAKGTMHERIRTATTLRHLGVVPNGPSDLVGSEILKVLGADWFAEFAAIRAPGTLIWWNVELARQLGFQMPQTNEARAEFQARLVSNLSLRSLTNGEVRKNQHVTIFADKYGGDGVAPALGAGRAGFMPYGNLYVKGLGLTPLFKHNDPDDFAHSHGELHMDDCLAEAVFGEVNENLFTQGAARVLAIIDQGRSVTAPSGLVIPVCLLIRAGAQLRPGHLVGSHLSRGSSRLKKFLRMTRASDQLVKRRDPKTRRTLPDVRATMLRIIDDHALTAAEGFRWRLIHGAVTPSNMDLSGAMLDLPTQSAQPRTASICSIGWGRSIFGREHKERAMALVPMYRAIRRHTSAEERARLNVGWINIAAEMDTAYRRHLEVKLLCATGLKTKVAQLIQDKQAALTKRFADLILRMAALKNPGTTRTWESTVEAVSVLDVFGLLQRFPETYFANAEDHTEQIRHYLKPIFKGDPTEVAKKKRLVEVLIRRFANLFPAVMKAAAVHIPRFYQDQQHLQTSIKARSAFENEPMPALYAKSMSEELRKLISVYRQRNNPEIIRSALNERITTSLRSVDRLLSQGTRERLLHGGLELERQTIDGISYSVRAWNDPPQTRRLHVSIPVERRGNQYVSAVPSLPPLTRRQIETLCLRFTTDGWKSSMEITAQLRRSRNNEFMIEFEEIVSFPSIGRLDAVPYFRPNRFNRNLNRLGGYVFAIPDQDELINLA